MATVFDAGNGTNRVQNFKKFKKPTNLKTQNFAHPSKKKGFLSFTILGAFSLKKSLQSTWFNKKLKGTDIDR